MLPAQRQKQCPRCGQLNIVTAVVCSACGHQFRTQFAPDPTVAMPVQNPVQPQVPMIPPPSQQAQHSRPGAYGPTNFDLRFRLTIPEWGAYVITLLLTGTLLCGFFLASTYLFQSATTENLLWASGLVVASIGLAVLLLRCVSPTKESRIVLLCAAVVAAGCVGSYDCYLKYQLYERLAPFREAAEKTRLIDVAKRGDSFDDLEKKIGKADEAFLATTPDGVESVYYRYGQFTVVVTKDSGEILGVLKPR